MNIDDQLRPIRIQLRRMMNGVTSATMRKAGADYALNYGVSLPQLRQYASTLEKDEALADLLWEQRARETKMLACLLHPQESFTESKAAKWIEESPNVEISRVLTLSLLQYMPYAEEQAVSLVSSDNTNDQVLAVLTGYSLLTRLCIQDRTLSEKHHSLLFDQSIMAIKEGVPVLQEVAAVFLKRWSSSSKQIANIVSEKIKPLVAEKEESGIIFGDIIQDIAFFYE